MTVRERIEFNGEKTVTKWLSFDGPGGRELSFVQLLKNCPFVLLPLEIKETIDQVGLVFSFAPDLSFEFEPEPIFRQAIQILASLEKHNIIHLDFRPENLAIYQGKLYLRDFGNAYLASSARSYLPSNRYPLLRIRAPEFQEYPASVRGLRGLQALTQSLQSSFSNEKTQLLPVEFRKRYISALLERLDGSEFDCRADLWSLGCWMYYRLIGQLPINHPGDYQTIDFEPLKKCGKIGFYLEAILSSLDYQKRPWTNQIAQELELSSYQFNLELAPLELHHQHLEKATLPDVWSEDEAVDNGMVTAQYLWILLASQRSKSSAKEITKLFAQESLWDKETVEIFRSLKFQLYTKNVLTSYQADIPRENYFSFLREPLSLELTDLSDQQKQLLR